MSKSSLCSFVPLCLCGEKNTILSSAYAASTYYWIKRVDWAVDFSTKKSFFFYHKGTKATNHISFFITKFTKVHRGPLRKDAGF